MCGIAGVHAYHYAANPVDRAELIRIRDQMRRRGPDAEGAWWSDDGRVGFGHRRLAIIDLDPRSNQPMVSDDGRLVITFNGEIYNFRELRGKLEARGHRFRTQSDTEVLLKLYREHGVDMFRRLRGMYAFAIWDADKAATLLARDPYGIKPLYYADDGWTCRFASQVKALIAGERISRESDSAGLVGFYLLGTVPEPFTLYRGICAVPAGSYLWIDALGAHEPIAHFSLARAWSAAAKEGAASRDPQALRDALLDSVKHHLVADVPVGAFLSAGVDSGALVGLMRDAGQRHIKTVTVAFDEFKGSLEDEAPLAAETAQAYETDHRVYRVTQAEFREDLPRILEAMDQPSIDGINTWFVAKATAAQGLKVAISGLGGDELFGGYSSFRDIPRWRRWLALPSLLPGSGTLFRRAMHAFAPQANPKIAGLLEFGGSFGGAWFLRRGVFMPWDLESFLDPDVVGEGLERLRLVERIDALLQPAPATAFGRVSTLESALYMRNQLLRDTDWASMAHSLEVRVPYVDPILLGAVARQHTAVDAAGKAVLSNSPSRPLPQRIAGRRKVGFVTPIPQWLQQAQGLDSWRGVPQLSQPACPWARRWSHVIGSRFVDSAPAAA